MLQEAPLKPEVRRTALGIFARIARAEARVHGVPVEEVGFHEVGAVDSIVDIVAVAVGLEALGVTRVTATPIPLGRGFTWSQHGRIPVPAPATMFLLEGLPVVPSGLDKELVTPTGAGILAAIVDEFCELPSFTPMKIGHGGGTRRLPDRPNMVRAMLGEAPMATRGLERSQDVVLEANLDDASGELCGYVTERLLEAGALDVWWSPVLMKKGRPAQVLSVLCEAATQGALLGLMLRETTTLGVRARPVERWKLSRRQVEVETPWGAVSVKLGQWGEEVVNVAPEYESARRVARASGAPLKQVLQAAVAGAQAAGLFSGE